MAIITLANIPYIQNWIGEEISDAFERKLGTKVVVGKVDIGLLNRVIMDGVEIYDQQNKLMVKASRLAAKLDYYQLVKNRRLYISSAQIFGMQGNFYKQDAISEPNYQFALDSLSSKDKTTESNLELSINSLIIRHGAIKYDRYDMPYTHSRFNVNHLNISDISAHLIIPFYDKDNLAIEVKKLSFKEASGFTLNNLSFIASIDKQKTEISDFILSLPNTDIRINAITASYKYQNKQLIKESLRFKGGIADTKITLSDLSCFVPTFKSLSFPLYTSMNFSGSNDLLTVKKFLLYTKDQGIYVNATGHIQGTKNTAWHADVKELKCNVPKISELLDGMDIDGIKVPQILTRLGNVSYKGNAAGQGKDISANGVVSTDVGSVKLKVGKNGTHINLEANTDDINLKDLLDNNSFGTLAANIKINGYNENGGFRNTHIDATVERFDYKGYHYQNLSANGILDNKSFTGSLAIDDPNALVNIEGSVNIDKQYDADIIANVRNLNPMALNLSNKWGNTDFDFNIAADCSFSGNKLLSGNISLNNLLMKSEESTYNLYRLDIAASKDSITMKSDFGYAEITGNYTLASIPKSMTNLLNSKLPTLFPEHSATDNHFHLEARITKSDWLENLLQIPLTLDSPLTLKADVDETRNIFDVFAKADRFTYDGSDYEKAMVYAYMPNDTLTAKAQVSKVMKNGHRLSLRFRGDAADDKLSTIIDWNNHQPHPIAGTLSSDAIFSKNANGKPDVQLSVNPSEIIINDTTWTVHPAEISYVAGDLAIDHFAIEHNRQHIKIDGLATKNPTDSITVDLQDVDINYILDLVNFHSVDFKGYLSGKAYVKSVFFEPDAYADITVKDFKFQDGRMGTLSAAVNWNKTEKQIDIDAHADDKNGVKTLIGGYVSPSKNFIDLGFTAQNTNIEFLESFCGSFMGDVNARANGELRLIGPLKDINLTGMIRADGTMRIKPLNVTYTLDNDTIRFIPDNIIFAADSIRDRNGNIGIVNGTLHHESLRRLTYDLSITTDNLLCYDTHSYGDDTFYGTAYGTGICNIQGGNGKIDIDINITPQRGSFIEYNAASPESISDLQFITWNEKSAITAINQNGDGNKADTTNVTADENKGLFTELRDIPSDMRINFIFNMTPDATLRVLMDQGSGDYIALNGTGGIRATYFNKGSFDMFGTYLIDHGVYKLTIQNIIKKEFQFQPLGTVVFGGDPYNAALNLKAIYTINGVPLSDLQLGNSFSSNNVRVDCIMNIGGTPQAPHVEFDLDMPTVNSDAKQMVRTLINGEEEMNQQVVYLLSVGRFYMQNKNNATQSENDQTQTSLAMQSLLSGTISQQINSLLGNLVDNNNWTFGANISTGDEGFNNAEYEGLLSGRLLNNRLQVNGQFGYRDNANATTSFIGDFDISYLLVPNGNVALKVYNQTNDRYFTKSSLNTQGVGLMLKKDFDSFFDLFRLKRKKYLIGK